MAIVTDNRNSVRTTSETSPRTVLPQSANSWQQEMRAAIRDVAELCRLLHLPAALADETAGAVASFPLFVPRPYLARIEPGNPNDPLLRQVLPVATETQNMLGFSADPVGDQAALRAPGLIQKYPGRALLITATACAVHCRYCFRREFPYRQTPHTIEQWQPALDWLTENHSIEEIILSGGDPLTLVDERMEELIGQLISIRHITRLRVHSRLPIMIPQRITTRLVEVLAKNRLATFFVIHSNHADEIDDQVAAAIAQLIDAGIPVLNQAVLLKGVNDSLEALVDLSRRLIDLRVMPYYLNQLDRVSGAAHFEVPIGEGMRLVEAMRSKLPGYAVPSYVVDDGNGNAKTLLR